MHSPRTTPHSPFRCPSRILLALLVAASLSTSLHAATYEYTGGGTGTTTAPATGTWSATRWLGGVAPTSNIDNVLTFGGSGSSTYKATNTNGGALDLNQIILNSSSSGLSTIALGTTLGTSTLNFVNNTASSGPRITQNGSGDFLITGLSTLTDTLTIGGGGTGTIEFNTTGFLSGAGGLIMNGAGVLRLSQNNSFTGGLTINSGTVDAVGNAAGTRLHDAVTLAGGTLILTADTNVSNWSAVTSVFVTANSTVVSNRETDGAGKNQSFSAAPLTIGANTLTVQAGSHVTSGIATLSFLSATLTGDATFAVNSGAELKLGKITGSGHSLTKSGAGNHTINGTTTVDQLFINEGTITLGNGKYLVSSAISVASGATFDVTAKGFTFASGQTLGGAGVVLGTVNTTDATSILSAGNAAVGTLTMDALNAAKGATFNFDLGTSSDLLAITGAFTGSTAVGGLTFNFNDAGGLAAGGIYTLLTFDSATGLDASDLATGSIALGFALDTAFGTDGYLINNNNIQVRFARFPSPRRGHCYSAQPA